ncbi:hypothetical protein SLS53_006125 [Cytospora paraplurivora]|uniref:Peptidase S8/S53 domain-containing protein n=1 Tax=Cytospora paraplurivora TaxID=2898453 RepID=A0AAN9UBS7_9PEZI
MALYRENEWSDEDDDRLIKLAWQAIKERKGKFTGEEDVEKFLRENRNLIKQAGNGSSNMLHAIVELLGTSDINKLDDILPLVKCLVQDYPYLLHTWDGRKQNPVFFAIWKKQWTLADHMIKYCDDNNQAQLCLEKALEMPCSTEENKTCLHLALEGGTKPTLLLKLVKLANDKALEAQDNDGNTPLHYAVIYSHCSDERVEIVKSFLERDQKKVLEHTKTASGQPLETFLDLKNNSNRSVYQEHLATAEWYQSTGAERRTLREEFGRYSHREADEGVRLRGGEIKRLEERQKSWELDSRRAKSRDGVSLPPGVGGRVSLQARSDSERAANTPIKRAPTTELQMKEGEKAEETNEATNDQMKSFPRNSQKIFFDYKGLPEEISADLFKKTFSAMQFDEVLKYVRFTQVNVRRRRTPRDKAKELGAELGRRDMEFFSDWLYDKGVRHILKLTVEENGATVHNDRVIKTVLNKVMVEHLDWQKTDSNAVDPEAICGISSQAENTAANKDDAESAESTESTKTKLRVLDLKWSGKSAVLRSWNEPQGLPLLQNLQTVNIILPEDVDVGDETCTGVFWTRLNQNIVDSTNGDASPSRERRISVRAARASGAKPLSIIPKKVTTTHEWLNCMERFGRLIKPFWDDMVETSKRAKVTATTVEDDVVVALIDDGVGALDEYFAGRVLDGKSFDYHNGMVRQHYSSGQGNGTEMAKLILRVCPMAKIYPIRLKTHVSANGESMIDLESAALAVQAAREKDARIISMSWSIPVPTGEQHRRERELFENAIDEACEDKRLLFCSSPDKGQFTSNEYPSEARRGSLFRIGAAHDDGTRYSWADKDVDYIFPGVKVNTQVTAAARRTPLLEITGSGVASALAAGLAATIIYCFKTSALAGKTAWSHRNPQDTLPSILFTEKYVRNIAEFPAMKTAFSKIGVINDERFIQVWDLFEPVSQILEDPKKTHEDKVETIVRMCSNLMD